MSNLDLMLYRLAYHMAIVDGEVSTNEATLLSALGKSLGLSEADIAGLKKEADRIDFSMLRRIFPERQQQFRLFEIACLVAMADGRSDLQEWTLATKLTDALSLDREEARFCLEAARKRLRDLAKDHDLAPEIRANLKTQGIE
jgi:DnaJ-domain-containing protein 1